LNCDECEDRLNNATFLRKELVPQLLSSMGVEDNTYAVYDSITEKFFRNKASGDFTDMLPGLIDVS
jgi:hypothetical protein